jgi:hypothetical protein
MRSFAWSALAFLVCATAVLAACPGGNTPPPDPAASIFFERVDTSRYPEIDVFFRVIDTNPTRGFHEPRAGEIRIEDGPTTGLAAMQIQSDNFAAPIKRPLSMALCLDRSDSVKPVIDYILNAMKGYISLMVDAPGNTPRLPDQTYLNAFCGGKNLRKVKEALFPPALTFNRDESLALVEPTFKPTCGGSPIYAASQVTLDRVGAHPFEEPDSARAAIIITDGKNNRKPETPDELIKQAKAAGIYVFTIGPVLIKRNSNKKATVAGKSVCRQKLIEIATESQAAYFEAVPPGVVRLPDPPQPPDEDTPPGTRIDPQSEAVQYLQETLLTVKNIAKQSPTLDKSSDLKPEVADVVQRFTTLNVSPTTWNNYITALEAGPPTIKNPEQITYGLAEQLDLGLEAFAAENSPEIDEETIKKTYDDQIRQMMQKIQSSLKNVYRVTYTVPDAPFDGVDRMIRISTTYITDFNGTARTVNANATTTYKAPVIAEENKSNQLTLALMNARANQLSSTAPRGGDWTSEIQAPSRVVLCGMVGNPGKAVKLAEKLPGQPETWPAEADGGPAVPLTDVEKEELRPYLTAVDVQANPITNGVAYTVKAGLPTSIPDPANANAQPIANDAIADKPRLLWYAVWTTLTRSYTYVAKLPDDVTETRTAVAKAPLNPLLLYIKDVTPPTVGVYLTPESRGTSRLIGIEQPIEQSPPKRAYFLQGASFGLPSEAKQLTKEGNDVGEALEYDGGSSIGFVVQQGVSVRLSILARDNFDRNAKPEWPPPDNPAVNRYDDATPSDDSARDMRPPFLTRLNPDQFDTSKDSNKTKQSGVTWSFIEGGSDTDPGVETKSFRTANVDGDTFAPIAGNEVTLFVRAIDATGNKTTMKIPIRVTPVGIEIDKLFQERERK